MPAVGESVECAVCTEKVFFNEERRAAGKVYHEKCFKCTECAKKLEATQLAEHDEKLYCTMCHRTLFGPSGYGYAAGASGLSSNAGKSVNAGDDVERTGDTYVNKEDPECCPRCGKKVYFAEQILYLNRKWHNLCFKCNVCSKVVDSTSLSDHGGEVYCKECYSKKFGPKGYGYAGGAGGLSSVKDGVDGEEEAFENTRREIQSPGDSYVNREDPACCPRCGMRVYFAEEVPYLSRKWHKLCFKCVTCSKTVDTANVFDHRGEIYCALCHKKNFGPKGYGYAGGAGGLCTDGNGESEDVIREDKPSPYVEPDPMAEKIKALALQELEGTLNVPKVASLRRSEVNEDELCPRCGKEPYLAERTQGGNKFYHKGCFSCLECKKMLDPGTVCVNQDEIFCKVCYSKKFGPVGYGYGSGAGALQMAGSVNSS